MSTLAPGADKLADTGKTDGIGERISDGRLLVGHAGQARPSVAAANDLRALRQLYPDGRIAVGEAHFRHGAGSIAGVRRIQERPSHW